MELPLALTTRTATPLWLRSLPFPDSGRKTESKPRGRVGAVMWRAGTRFQGFEASVAVAGKLCLLGVPDRQARRSRPAKV